MAKEIKEIIEINKINDLDPTNENKQKEINAQLADIMKDPSINRPEKEEIDKFKIEYEEAAQAFGIGRWSVGKAKEGDKIRGFLRDFASEKYMWKENQWMGIIQLDKELDQIEETYNLGGKKAPINFSYQAIEFVYHMLQNPGGIGLKAAKDFEDDREMYSEVFDAVGNSLQEARSALKEVDFAQQKWAAGEQGFYLEIDDTVNEKEKEAGKDNGTYFDKELDKDVKPGEPEYDLGKFQKIMNEKYGGLEDPLTIKKV